MTTKLLRYLASLGGVLFSAAQSPAVNVTVPDSIVSLATNGTKHYTFKDPTSGEGVIVRVTMTAFSNPPGDMFTVPGAGTRVAIGPSGSVTGDGNSIDNSEGVNFEATLAFASGGVEPDTIRFRIGSLGMRGLTASNASLEWISSADAPPVFAVSTERPYLLDPFMAPLHGTKYSARLEHPGMAGPGSYQLSDGGALIAGDGIVMTVAFETTDVEAQANSWLTTYAGRYARIYRNDVARTNGVSVTTWVSPTGKYAQALPAYCGVQEIYSSADWVYIRSTGLGSYVMGAWTNAPLGAPFPDLPTNQHSLWRFPRAPSVSISNTFSPASTIGYFVDGVAMFNSWSGYFWNGKTNTLGGAPGGYWNADAYMTEGATFDQGLGHPESTGRYHYHANPIALRYLLGDHVDFDPIAKTYAESTGPVRRHSPILGWVNDGFPLYGPYGYANALDAASGVRRMISGYVQRDGTHGTEDVSSLGRTNRPAWAKRLFTPCLGVAPCVPPASVNGPAVTTPATTLLTGEYKLGYYMEDSDYLGDHGYQQGTDFDLDEFNGRWCVTPEFPAGTYAYFVAITSNGLPAFPYNIGRGYFGEPTGGSVTTMSGILTTNFLSGTNMPTILDPPVVGGGKVILTWSAVEGGTYQVERTAAFSAWAALTTNATAILDRGSYTDVTSEPAGFYRVGRGKVGPFDPVY